MKKLKLSEVICKILNENKNKFLVGADEDIIDVKFEAVQGIYSKVTSFEKLDIENISLEKINIENNIEADYIKIFLYNQNETRKLKIWLHLKDVSTRYLTNNGVGIEGAKFLMQLMADLKQEKTYLIYGRQREFTFNPKEKRVVELSYFF